MTHPKNDEKDEFDLQNFLPFLLNQAAEASSLEFQQVYKNRFGMLRTEWRVLFHLGNYGEMTARDIGQRAKIHKTKISRAVHKLEQRRFLRRIRDENDRRVERLSLTQMGTSAYRELRSIARNYDGKLAAQFTTAEAELLRTMLRRLAGLD
ncbi:MarR family winged helix-turn-helix transcriptional regulator [Ruegeria arenilitoris]|uniref:MarR family winged helix-turn-helix transcriptional regulator n=1 Tax=Ruegeria arenilitoris TaxID=1173585 RepID=UPI00147E6B21|nr:MarR family transcriptional regulator [Ruegeria arenilitoris]